MKRTVLPRVKSLIVKPVGNLTIYLDHDAWGTEPIMPQCLFWRPPYTLYSDLTVDLGVEGHFIYEEGGRLGIELTSNRIGLYTGDDLPALAKMLATVQQHVYYGSYIYSIVGEDGTELATITNLCMSEQEALQHALDYIANAGLSRDAV